PLSDQGAHSFLATGRQGQALMVHVLDIGSEAERRQFAGRVQAVLRAGSDRILDIVEVEGVTAVVTRFMLEFVSFRAWIDEVSPAPIRSTEVATPPYLTPPSSAASPRSFAAADLEET